MRIHYLQHVAFEGPAAIASWAEANGHSLTSTLFHQPKAALPSQDDFDWLIVLGGPMNVYETETYPWLAAEKSFVRDALASGKTVLGVCLGAQLLADVLGAHVVRNPQREIGWFPLELSEGAADSPLAALPDGLPVFHWHGDTFELPYGAVHLAQSEACHNQAFLWNGKVLGLQFHLETTPQAVRRLIAACESELVPGAWVQSKRELRAADEDFEALNLALFDVILNALAS